MKSPSSSGYLISKINQVAGRIFNKLLKDNEIEINRAQGKIMFALWKKDGITIKELAKETSLSKSTMTPMLDRLEKMGYLLRVPSKTDRRTIQIERTAKDKKMQETYNDVSKEMTEITYKDFTVDEIDTFEKYLERVFDNLNTYESK
ncbi:MAG: MarR family winged helix-turn-helix transcriptional regulator [Candidatus Heimdallarchaeota archaeon]